MTISAWRGPGWRVADAHPRSVGELRRWVTAAVVQYGCPVDADDVAAVTSELVTNALMHGPAGGRVLVGYCLWREGARLVVCDGGSGTPRLCHPDERAEGMRGLQIVGKLAARWDFFRAENTLAVWCDLGQPLHVPDRDAWAWLRLVLSLDSLSAPVAAPVTAVPARLPGRCAPTASTRGSTSRQPPACSSAIEPAKAASSEEQSHDLECPLAVANSARLLARPCP